MEHAKQVASSISWVLFCVIAVFMLLFVCIVYGTRRQRAQQRRESKGFDAILLEQAEKNPNPQVHYKVFSMLEKRQDRKLNNLNSKFGQGIEDLESQEQQVRLLERQLSRTRQKILKTGDGKASLRVLQQRAEEMYGSEWNAAVFDRLKSQPEENEERKSEKRKESRPVPKLDLSAVRPT